MFHRQNLKFILEIHLIDINAISVCGVTAAAGTEVQVVMVTAVIVLSLTSRK